MKKSSISRRIFVKKLSTGTVSFSMLPYVWNKNKENIEQLNNDSIPKFFDCNKYFGSSFKENPDYPNISDLLASMDRLNIDRAVAWHTDARVMYPMAGNEKLLQEIESVCAQDRIIPSLIIAPSMIDDSTVMGNFLNIVKTHNIRAFHYFYTKKFNWTLPDITPVIQAIRTYNPVLFLNVRDSLGNMDDVLSFSQEFPDVSIVFTDAMHTQYPRLYTLMKERSNIFVDTSQLHTYRIIENIIKLFGKERLVFGTGYKSNNGASIASLVHSEITSEHAQLIAHGNLERLMGIKSPLKGYTTIVGDKLWHRLLRKEHLGPEILDAHTHHCNAVEKWSFNSHDFTDFDGFVSHNLRSMDKMGVKTMFVAETKIYPPDTEKKGETYMEEHMSPYGDRFRGYFCAEAFMPKYKDKMIPRLDEIFSRPYYIGFKTHNDHWRIPINDPCFIPMWEYANAHRLPILLHTWNTPNSSPKLLEQIAPRYPNAIFILGHSGNVYRPDAEQLVQDNQNVYLEWCGSFLDPTDWRETLDRVGNRRLVYGSDGVSWSSGWGHNPAWEMGRFLSLDVPDETLLPILGDNMRRILAQRR